jgi:hypothetical protein
MAAHVTKTTVFGREVLSKGTCPNTGVASADLCNALDMIIPLLET